MEFVKGPDFPTGGVIASRETILQAYSTGRGKIIVRGRGDIEEQKNGQRHRHHRDPLPSEQDQPDRAHC